MTTATPAPATIPLLDRHDASTIVAYRHGRAIGTAEFLDDVARVAAALPPGRHVLNTCADRYCFAVGFAAILVSERISLLPSTLTAQTIGQLKVFAPDAFHLTDGMSAAIDLPAVTYPEGAPFSGAMRAMPEIAPGALAAYVFTSGSTGLPVPHRKRWGALANCVRAEGNILGLRDGRRHAVLGTVPPQHMYGFESTVLAAMQNGVAFAAARPLYPADICGELSALPRPRVLVTTPFHLRTLLEAEVEVPALDLIVSATAPLSPQLARETEHRYGAPLIEIYGSTETGQIAHRRTIEGAEWRLFPGVRLDVATEQTWAMGGHLEDRIAMDDVLELVDDDRFLMHGRSADMVNIAGKRSSIGYLNHQLCAIPGVVDGVFALPDGEPPDGITRLHAAVVAPTLDHSQLTRALRERVDPAFMPRRIVFVDKLPRNATGKLPATVLQSLFARRDRGGH
ncbi:MAG: AMP-binding protein [Betaproteobacteria bacterium]